eukprot:scaffold54264_cov26-Tisochrysis_lutea.AAC.1
MTRSREMHWMHCCGLSDVSSSMRNSRGDVMAAGERPLVQACAASLQPPPPPKLTYRERARGSGVRISRASCAGR